MEQRNNMKLLYKSRHFIKNHKIITAILVSIVGIILFFFRPKASPSIPTQTVKHSHFLQSVSVSGTIQAKNFANLTFLTTGKLVYLGVKKGDSVKQYQTIATLDQRSAQKTLQASLFDYAKQRNSFDQTKDDNQNRTPQQALNDAMKRVLQDNQYNLEKAVTSVELQTLANEQSLLTTPIAGIVTRADVENVGINISPATTFSVVDPNSIVFNMDVDEADIGKITIGQKVAVTLDAFPDKILSFIVNRVDFVSHNTSTGGTAYTVEVKMPQNSTYQYKIGMNGNGEIITNEKNNVISLPINAFTDDRYVYVETGVNQFKKRKVSFGLQNDTNVEVTNGLQLGEKVALDTISAEKKVKK